MAFKQFIRFTNDAGGLEKILRLLQSLSQVLAAWALTNEDEIFWLFLRRQFALGRRYFRFFKFLDCFSKAWACFHGSAGLAALLETGKWSCMGLYLMLESFTILDAIGVWPTPKAESCMLEANRFWFYSLVCSIVWGLMQIHGDQRVKGASKDRTEKKEDGSGVGRTLKGVKRRLVSDCFDLLIPGHVTGRIKTSTATVGFASVVSTTLSSKDIWDRIK